MNGNGPPDLANMGGFDFSALHDVLNDPNIKQMAEQIAQDPAFAQMSAALQASMANGGPGAAAGPGGAPAVDPEQYAQAMAGVLGNPGFMEMAEKLGQQIMNQDPAMAGLLQNMQDPQYRDVMGGKLEELKKDPELGPILEEIQESGPAALMKYWSDPVVLEKLSKAMGPAMAGMEQVEGGTGEQEGEEEEGPPENVHEAASSGDPEALRQLIKDGANKDEQDEEGRTALHFACGYGELDCAKVLLEEGANVDVKDHNDNTALHYAAGYGEVTAVALLLEHKAALEPKNKDGKTAQEVAELNEQKDIVDLLTKHTGEAKA
jgi:hypothetical protein